MRELHHGMRVMPPPNEQALNAAVDWLVHREASEPSAADREAFQHWLDQDASHRGAWERVNSALAAPLQTIRTLQPQTEGQPVNAALQTLFKTRRRRVLRGALGVAGVTAASAFVAHRWAPLGQVMADLRTRTGERRAFTLADGTTVLLDARSAVNVRYVADVPSLQHKAGALIATRAFTGPAPLSIHTRHGQAQMDAGRLMSRVHADRTDLVALEGLLHFQPLGLAQSRLRTGEGASFSGGTLERLQGNVVDRAAWQQGMLAVDDWPLGDVVNAIQAYYPGFIRVAPSVSGLRVFGIFQLDVQLLLETLAQTLPVQIRRLGPLVSIDAKPPR